MGGQRRRRPKLTERNSGIRPASGCRVECQPAVPPDIRESASQWGSCGDGFTCNCHGANCVGK
ncbi:hypothetical protein DPMN_075997 [Dreissena polymorpha]|uniref:Uncharacterized protein n=1 Tax=Dreissena polymorpha TaxID=45954 RepID=A0A9D4BM05_DREPO|nr:hypothetical protein DPMN_075997 [Dreissena polymorpha]